MINIAIVDDEKIYCEQIKILISQHISTDYDYAVATFNSGKNFVDSIDKIVYDIVYLDIEVGEINGLEVARILREKYYNVIIIFVTSHTEYVSEVFRRGAFQLLSKPINQEDFALDINRAIEKYTSINNNIVVCSKNKVSVIEIKDIICVEVNYKEITIHTVSGKLKLSGSINEYKKKLSTSQFVVCHKSIIVNMAYIENITRNDIKLKGIEQPMPFSRNFRQQVLERFNRYVTGEII